MKILICGCGWYGCHAAVTLLKMGIEIRMADIANDFFCGSSSKNQNRLHLGFHYCRSYATRQECFHGFTKFMETYAHLTDEIPLNLYFIDKKSAIDDHTYKHIFLHEKIKFEEAKITNLAFPVEKESYHSAINVDERYIDHEKAKLYFKNLLDKYVIRNYNPELLQDKTYDNENFDYIIDCTFRPLEDTFYEECISLVYKYVGPSCPKFALTVVDGPFWSLYPYGISKNLYTLTDVENTPLIHGNSIECIKQLMENKVRQYVPEFDKLFSYENYFKSHKIKPKHTKTDDRSMMWSEENGIIKFVGGKLTGIFSMEDVLKNRFQVM